MKKALIILAFIFFGSFSLATPPKADAASIFANFKLPNAFKVKVDAVKTDENLRIYFSNLFIAKKVTYELTYTHDSMEEGVTGQFNPNGKVVVIRDIILGTCSTGGNCVYHSNITNMKLRVTVKYNFFNTEETKLYNIN